MANQRTWLAPLRLVIAASLLALVLVASFVFLQHDLNGTGKPESIGIFMTKSVGGKQVTYVALRDSSGSFVASAGTFNFSVTDTRGHKLFSALFIVEEKDFKTYGGAGGPGQFLGYTWNFSTASMEPGVPMQNGSGFSRVVFTQPDGLLLRRVGHILISSLPRITITELNVTKKGSLAPYLTISSNVGGLTAFAGDVLMKNISLFFFNLGDEGQPLVSASAIKAVFSIQTSGFDLIGIIHPGTGNSASPLFVQSNNGATVTLELRVPDTSYTGPLSVQVTAEPWS